MENVSSKSRTTLPYKQSTKETSRKSQQAKKPSGSHEHHGHHRHPGASAHPQKSTTFKSAESSTSSGDIDLKVQESVKRCVDYVLAHPDTCPRYLAYSDEMLIRAREALGRNVKVSCETQDHVQCDLLYFIILRQLVDTRACQHVVSQPGVDRSRALAAADEMRHRSGSGDSISSSLWQVLDGIVSKEAALARKAEHRGRAESYKNEGEDECWREFWEHYRASSAKRTHVDVASARAYHGGRIATTGAFPTVTGRIMEEFKNIVDPPDGDPFAQAVFSRKRRLGSKDRPMERQISDSERGFTMETIARASASNSKGFNRSGPKFASNSKGFNQATGSRGSARGGSRGSSSANSGTPTHTQNRALSREGNQWRSAVERVRQSGSKGRPQSKEGWPEPAPRRGSNEGQVKLPALVPKLPQLQLEASTHVGHGPTSKFTGWDDYKLRRGVIESCLEAPTQRLISAAMQKPQREVTVALLEHRAAAEWRMCKAMAREQLGSRQLYLGGALSARSRQMHLPPVVKGRGHQDGSQTDRLHDRRDVRIPPASFRRPWSREEREFRWDTYKVHKTISIERFSAIERYAMICKNTGLYPQAVSVRFLGQKSPNLSVRGADYSDDDLLALIASIPRDGSITLESFDIAENPRLTDASACMVLEVVSSGVLGPVQVLQLDHCRNFGKSTIKLCTEMLLSKSTESLTDLKMLDLSGMIIRSHDYLELARAVQMHPRLRDVRLAETGLGRSDKAHASHVISMLVEADQLQALDLSWNMLDTTALQKLGKGLADHDRLSFLGLVSSGSSWDPVLEGSSILVFLEHLSADTSLTSLNVSSNNLSEGAGMILEAACRSHPSLHHLDISSNPLGLNGKRALLRLLASEECPNFTELNCEDCSAEGRRELDLRPLDVDPSGNYHLNLEHPVKRAFLRLLLNRCTYGPDGVPLPKLLLNARYKDKGTEKPFNFNLLQLTDCQWKMPMVGELSFDLDAGEVVLGSEESLSAEMTIADRIEMMARRSRLKLSGGVKTLAVLSQAKRAKKAVELNNILLAITSDFVLTPEQVQGLCRTRVRRLLCGSDCADVLSKLLPCLSSVGDIREGCFITRTLNDLFRLHVGCHRILSLNMENPTGHYDLLLSDPSQLAVAQRLLLLNRWELHVWKTAGMPDISQHGTGKNFRNAKFGGRSWSLPAEDWRLPAVERLTFDYVSLRRPPVSAEPVKDETFQIIMRVVRDARTKDYMELLRQRIVDSQGRARKSLFFVKPVKPESVPKKKGTSSGSGSSSASDSDTSSSSDCAVEAEEQSGRIADLELGELSEISIIHALWALSPHFFLLCRQLREMLCVFNSNDMKYEVLTVLFLRVIDWPMNLSLCRSKLDNQMWRQFQQRVGYVLTFPFFQPEGYFDSLDLSVNEQRRIAHCLTSLCSGENPLNIQKPRMDWLGPRGSPEWETLPVEVPTSWSTWEELPKQGVFEATYSIAATDSKLRLRRKLCAGLAGYTALPDDEEELSERLKVWSTMGCIPEDVHHFIYFVVCHFKCLTDAFKQLDTNSDGELSMMEFVSGCKEIGFKLPVKDREEELERQLSGGQFTAGTTLKKEGRSSKAESRGSALKAHRKLSSTVVDEVADHLKAVFRRLDPNDDGKVTVREFLALEGLWRELKQTMWEFVDHLRETYETVEASWAHADIDNSGIVDLDEFNQLVKKWKFDGPTTQVFIWMDATGSNSISKEEWMKLESIEKPVW